MDIYISYPYQDGPERRYKQVREIVKQIISRHPDIVPFIPHFAFHKFQDLFGREVAMKSCERLLLKSDVMCICLPKGEKMSDGMQREYQIAKKKGIKIIYLEDLLKSDQKMEIRIPQ